jgi:alpha-glucosidase
LDKSEKEGVEVSAIWAQDWEGKRITKFGSQLMWNWEYDDKTYPNLPDFIKELNNKDIKFLGYINPFLAIEKELYKEASEKGYLVKDKADEDYLINVTYFPASLLDLSNPDAVQWIKEIIKKNMIGLGLSGWMADFGEYLPINCKLHSGENPILFHNQYPVIWAKINREAIDEYKNEQDNQLSNNDIVFFSRAGYTGTSKFSPIIWAGDQNVNWSMNDGLSSVIPAGISLGFSGIGIHHSDIGGYTTVAWLKRTKELFMRWSEQAVFSPIMRTHEGNRPYRNWQFDSDEETLSHFAKMSKIHKLLKPYIKHTANEYYQNGLPVMRHPYIHYESDDKLHKIKYQYLFGRDMMIAPVYKPRRKTWKVYLPEDEWIHLWSGDEYQSGWIKVLSPTGESPVFYRKSSDFSTLFSQITQMK